MPGAEAPGGGGYTHIFGNFTTALFWVVAAGPVVSALLFPGYFIQGVKFPESLIAYAFSAVLFFFSPPAYI